MNVFHSHLTRLEIQAAKDPDINSFTANHLARLSKPAVLKHVVRNPKAVVLFTKETWKLLIRDKETLKFGASALMRNAKCLNRVDLKDSIFLFKTLYGGSAWSFFYRVKCVNPKRFDLISKHLPYKAYSFLKNMPVDPVEFDKYVLSSTSGESGSSTRPLLSNVRRASGTEPGLAQ